MRDYGRVHCAIWGSRDFRSLSEDGRALALYLLTCPHATMIGAFYLPEWYVTADLQWSKERVSEGFQELFRKGFATLCPRTQWVWIHRYLHWNEPENPNQWKGCRKLASKIPECSWFTDFQEFFDSAIADAEIENPKPFRKGSGRVSKPGTGTGTGVGTGKGSGGGTGTVPEGERAPNPVDNGDNSGSDQEGNGRSDEDLSGQSSPPEEPFPPKRGAAAERRNGDFEGILQAVKKILDEGLCKPGEYALIGRTAHISALQAEVAVRQLRDRRLLPKASAA